jgi:hypothetical protein
MEISPNFSEPPPGTTMRLRMLRYSSRVEGGRADSYADVVRRFVGERGA